MGTTYSVRVKAYNGVAWSEVGCVMYVRCIISSSGKFSCVTIPSGNQAQS